MAYSWMPVRVGLAAMQLLILCLGHAMMGEPHLLALSLALAWIAPK